jgi:hypothetical protein
MIFIWYCKYLYFLSIISQSWYTNTWHCFRIAFFRRRGEYSLTTRTTMRGLRALHPARDHWCIVSLISVNDDCAVFQHPLKIIAFHRFQMIHRVSITRVCSFFPLFPTPVYVIVTKASTMDLPNISIPIFHFMSHFPGIVLLYRVSLFNIYKTFMKLTSRLA